MGRSSLFVALASVGTAAALACGSTTSGTTPPLDGGGSSGGGSGSSSGGGSGSSSGGGSGGSSGSSSGGVSGYPAAHPAFPQLVDQGGPIIAVPKIVTVTFPGDSNATQLEAFGAQATSNPWWDTVRQGYCATGGTPCLSDGPAGTSVEVTAANAPAASYTDSAQGGPSTLQTYIQGLVTGGTIPQPDASTILVFYFPASTAITLDGSASCQTFGGYHNSTTAGGVTFTYAIIDECAPQTGGGGPTLSLLQETTFASSHEIVEAATDPYQQQSATSITLGFYLDFSDPAIIPWNNIGGGEAADMCVDLVGLGQDEATEAGFTVQRIWSNAAAAAGGDPCVPPSTNTYFNVAPETWLLTIPVGGSATFTADAFSSAPMSSDFYVLGADLNATMASANPYLTITFGGAKDTTAKNGDKVTVTVTLNQDPGSIANYATSGGATGLLVTTNTDPAATASPSQAHYWPFLVVSPADAADSGLDTVDASEDLGRGPHVQVSRKELAHFASVFQATHRQ
jgi:hypothetical protein